MSQNRTQLAEGSPFYVQISEALKARIVAGEFFPSTRLPSESELEAIYGVSRVTVRQALRDLEQAGLIYRVHGKGTFAGRPKAAQDATEIRGFGAVMAEQGHKTVNRVLVLHQIAASKLVAERLRLEEGEPVTELKRLRLLDDTPISVDHTFVPARVGLELAKFDLTTRDVFEIFETELGTVLAQARLGIEAIRGTKELSKLLETSTSDPVLKVERLTSTANGEPIDFEYLYYRADRFRYNVTVSRHSVQQLS